MAATTLKDIADAVGMSPMTVSRALRGVGRVNEGTRHRIRQTAQRLGYVDSRHSLLAPPRHRGTTEPGLRLLVVAFPHRAGDDELSRELLRGMEARLGVNSGSLHFVTPDSLDTILAAWSKEKASGIVLRSELPSSWVQALARRGPVVYGASYDFHEGIDAVYSNEIRSAGKVQSYLEERGHRHVLWLGQNDIATMPETILAQFNRKSLVDRRVASIHGPRYAAWAYLAAQAESPALRQVVMFQRDWRRDSLVTAIALGFDELGTLDPRPTCIVVPTDIMGLAVLDVLRDRGLNVPRDISVISYGGTAVSRQSNPPLTAVKLPMYTIGRAIPELIERRLADPSAVAMSLQFEAQLIPGESVATLTHA